MKGYVRHIDDLGRIVIPREIMRTLGIGSMDQVNIEAIPGGIVIKPLKTVCVICGSPNDLYIVNGNAVCLNCACELAQQIGEKRVG